MSGYNRKTKMVRRDVVDTYHLGAREASKSFRANSVQGFVEDWKRFELKVMFISMPMTLNIYGIWLE